MKPLHVLHVDENHPILIEELQKFGFNNEMDYSTPVEILFPVIGEEELLASEGSFSFKTSADKTSSSDL